MRHPPLTRERRLPFCTIRVLAADLLEVEADPGVEIGLPQVRELQAAYPELAGGRPYGLLVVKVHSYTYTFEAQQEIFDQPQMRAAAFYAPDRTRRMAIRSLMQVGKPRIRCPIETFADRAEALAWLRKTLGPETLSAPAPIPVR